MNECTGGDLTDTNVLLVMSDEKLIATLSDVLKGCGATVHVAKNRFDAVGMYWKLYAQSIIPRAVVTKWWIAPPGSDQYKFFSSINRLEDCTALPVLKNAIKLDPSGLYIVYAKSIKEARAALKANDMQSGVYVCDRTKVDAHRLAQAISNNEITARYRMQKGVTKSEIIDISAHLENISERPTEVYSRTEKTVQLAS